jgi:hypothetical protein
MWDRFDDATDDIDREIHELVAESDRLKAELQARGMAVKDWSPPQDDVAKPGDVFVDVKYWNRRARLASLQAYVDELRKELS